MSSLLVILLIKATKKTNSISIVISDGHWYRYRTYILLIVAIKNEFYKNIKGAFYVWCECWIFAVAYLEHNNGGITLFGFALDRGLLHTLFAFEFSLVLWILSKVVVLSWEAVKFLSACARFCPFMNRMARGNNHWSKIACNCCMYRSKNFRRIRLLIMLWKES